MGLPFCFSGRNASVGVGEEKPEVRVGVRVAIGLGANLGDRARSLRRGIAGLRSLLDDVRESAVYETRPLHLENQPVFLNACCTGVSRLTPVQLLSRLHSLERAGGRKPGGPRFGPRVLDLDILLYGDLTVDDPDLTIPHARLRGRAFALIPLAELAADWVVPAGRNAPAETIGNLAAAVDARGVRRTDIRLDLR